MLGCFALGFAYRVPGLRAIPKMALVAIRGSRARNFRLVQTDREVVFLLRVWRKFSFAIKLER
jgi:hypothetical protein